MHSSLLLGFWILWIRGVLESLSKKEFKGVVYPDFGKSDSETTRLNYKSAIATRSSNGLILNALAKTNSGFVGGSDYLAPSLRLAGW